MFDEVTTGAFEAWTDPPKDMEAAMALWRDHWIAVGMLLTIDALLKAKGESQ